MSQYLLRPVLFLRSLAFYTGYVPVTIIMSALFITLFPLLPQNERYRFSAAWALFVLYWLRLTCGVRFQVKGLDNLPDYPVVVLANHQSSWETLYFYTLINPLAPILKKELLRIPFWGWALKLLQPIAIDRSKPRDAGKSLLKQGVKRLQQGYSVIIFPEGTRSPVGKIKHFSRGGSKLALAAGKSVLPIALDAGKCWPPRRFLKFPGLVTVEIGKVIAPEGHDANSITDAAESWIRQRVSAMGQ